MTRFRSQLNRTGKKDGLLTFAQRVEQGFPDAVGELATMLKVEIQQQLSRPGTGRYYAKLATIGQSKGEARAALVSFNRSLRSTVAALNDRRMGLEDVKKRQVRRLHRASAPGRPPAPDTGSLKRSAFVEQITGAFLVGVAMAYARWLEFGTPRIKPRPFMRPAAGRVQQKAGVSLQRQMKQLRAETV